MRMSRLLLRTLREVPGDAEAISHQLLVRAGYIRRLASGVYTFLPLGWRVLSNVARVVREEMDAAGAQELLMPILQPLDLWQQTGRDATMADVLLTTEGKGGTYVLGPTAEEVVTATAAVDIESYRDLPVNLYQIQTKFRDEARPRFGLLRCREFVMKDAYSFDASKDAMAGSYRLMYDAYCRVFERLGLAYVPVEAESGAIGGDVNHEFMVASAIGEDFFVQCGSCGYAANVEAAVAGERSPGEPAPSEAMVRHHTPDRPGIDLVVEFFSDRGLTAGGMLKCIAFVDGQGHPLVALVPGDRDVLPGRLGAGVRPFGDEEFAAHSALVKGYIGPMGLQDQGVRIVADYSVRSNRPWVTGANEADHHVSGATLGRDFDVDEWKSIATVIEGDPCPRCGHALDVCRAVEVGHTFQLGLTYSDKIPSASFLDESGEERPYWMGCYGIGVSRLPAVVAEEHHDESGLIWPAEIAPFSIHLVAVGAARSPEVGEAAERLYAGLREAGLEPLYDDRDLSPGVKFTDADLIGIPVQLIVGGRGLARGVVERKDRRSGERIELAVDRAVAEALG
jgi:prolyl-tRNA synthetase